MLSAALRRMKPSATTVATDRARRLAEAGRDVITLTFGEPDFDTPDNVKRAAAAAMARGETKYTPVLGIRPLREAIVAKFRADNDIRTDLDEVIVATGAKQVVFNALLATLDPGDEVIVPVPHWPSYPEMVRLAGGTVVPVRPAEGLESSEGLESLRLTPAALEAAITPRTKWLVLTTPSNPSGAVYTRAEIAALAAVLLRHPHVLVLADNIYEELVFDGRGFATPAGVEPALKGRTLTVNGVSKGHAMTGWRIGYGAGPRELIAGMEALQGQQTSGACSIAQWATVEALTGTRPFLDETRAVFERRRDLVVAMLGEARHLLCPTPEGTFYAFPSIEGAIGRRTPEGRRIADDVDFADALLECAGVGTVAGAAFGLSPRIRISFAAATPVLEEACRRIQRFCASLE